MRRRLIRTIHAATAMAVLLLAMPAGAQSLFHRAENQVQVALTKVVRNAEYIEVHVQTQAALKGVCWAAAGDNSPYLSADGQRYRYRKGGNVTDCPTRRDYADKEVMLLRFEPLPAQNHMFSLWEGHGGENQLIDPASTKGRF